jgi:hypothetical protein
MLFFSASSLAASFSVIVSSKSTLTRVTSEEVVRLYLGKTSKIQETEMMPTDYKDHLEIAKAFHKQVLKKTPLQYQQYWASLIFTGKAKPPLASIEKSDEMIEYVSSNIHAIGYVNTKNVSSKVRVVLVLEE